MTRELELWKEIVEAHPEEVSDLLLEFVKWVERSSKWCIAELNPKLTPDRPWVSVMDRGNMVQRFLREVKS